MKKILISICLLLLMAAGCSASQPENETPKSGASLNDSASGNPITNDNAGKEASGDDAEITVAIVPKALDNPIFLDTKTGGVDKAAELGITAEWAGPESSDAAGQVAVMEALIAKGVDGILVSCNDAEALRGVIDKAVASGIVVATFDSDSPDSKRTFYIGSDNYGIGKKCAEYINRLLPGGGKLAVLTGIFGAPNLEERITGLKENLGSNFEILPIQSGDDEIQKSVEAVNAFTAANPELAGWVFVGGWPFNADPASLAELKAFTDAGGVCVSVDTLYPMLQYVELEMAQALIGQNYYKMGSDGVQYIYDLIKNGKEPPGEIIDSGFEIVDKDNVKQALASKLPQ